MNTAGMPLVSVILPTYNRRKYLATTIDSILKQTYSNWELLVIDDGSKDQTNEMIAPYLEKDSRIKYTLLPQNRGASYARNTGIEQAAGEYLTFIDSDDLYHPEKIERQVKQFLNTDLSNVGVVTCGRNDYRGGRLYNKWKPRYRGFIQKELFQGLRIGAQTSFLMISRAAVQTGVRFDLTINVVEDFDLVAQTLNNGFALDFVDDYLVDIYHHEIQRNFDYPRAIRARDYLFTKYASFFEKNPGIQGPFISKSIVFYSMIKTRASDSTTLNLYRKDHPLSYQLFSLIKSVPPSRFKNALIKSFKLFNKKTGK